MSIDLLNLPASESERIAYAENFDAAARLFARIADAQQHKADAVTHLKAVLKAATEGDTHALTHATFKAYVFLDSIGENDHEETRSNP